MHGAGQGLEEFIGKYGERGYALLKAILEASRDSWARPGLGDFNFKTVKRIVQSLLGESYNPAPLLAKLEKEYNVIETSYRSGGHHWWRITDRAAIEEAVAWYEGREPGEAVDDVRLSMLRAQFYSLDPRGVMDRLARVARARSLGEAQRRTLRSIASEVLPLLVEWIERAEQEYPEELSREIELAREIVRRAEEAAARVSGGLKPARGGRVAEPVKYSLEAGFQD